MILVDKPKLKFLLAGRVVLVGSSHGNYRKGRTYAVGTRANRTICRVEVVKVVATADGFDLSIRQATEDKPRLLARNPGAQRADYVSEPSAAAADEPEAVDAETQRKLTELGTVRWGQEFALREAQRLSAHLHERLAALEREAKRPGAADVSGELRVIRARLKRLREDAA